MHDGKCLPLAWDGEAVGAGSCLPQSRLEDKILAIPKLGGSVGERNEPMLRLQPT